jgi:hypothetical protein
MTMAFPLQKTLVEVRIRLKAAFICRQKVPRVASYCGSSSVGKLFMVEGTAMPTPLTGDA